MSNESIINRNLFFLDGKPMKFYLDKGSRSRECTIQSWSAWLERIKTHGGILLVEPSDNAICLVDVLNINHIYLKSNQKKYDCRFLIDSIGKNQLMDLETYRITEQRSKNESPIDKLNDICLAEIFLKLPHKERIEMEKVCEKWKRASKLAWNDTTKIHFKDISNRGKNQFIEIEALITRCGKYLTDLIIHDVCDSRIMKVINSCCLNLKELDFKLKKYEENDCVDVFSKMEKLQSLKIFVLYGTLPSSLHSSIHSCAKSMTKLELGISPTYRLLSFPAFLLKTQFVKLRSLQLECFNLTLNCMEAIGQATNLVSLNFRSCRLERLNNIDLIFNLSNLEELNISEIFDGVNDYVFDDDFLIKLALCCKSLKSLNLCNSDHVTDKGIETLLQMEKLTELYLESFLNPYITDVSVRKFRNLTVLGIVNCGNISDTSIMELLEKLPNLKLLDVYGTQITNETLDLADKITTIRKNNVQLKIIVSYFMPNHFHPNKVYTSPRLKVTEYVFYPY